MAIAADENPESWLIVLSTLDPRDITGLVSLLRAYPAEVVPLRWRVQIIVLANDAGLLTVASSLPLIFRVLTPEANGTNKGSVDERLHDARVEWDCHEDLDVIPAALHVRFEALFREYLSDAQKISAILHLKHEVVA